MKILQVHNSYRLLGGEDFVVKREKKLLETNGHEVFQYLKDNNEIDGYSLFQKFSLFFSTKWNAKSYREMFSYFSEVRPDICHVHNYLPLISPAVFSVCRDLGIPVVQTHHNYRLVCVNGQFFRNGRDCTECLSAKNCYKSVRYRCYRNSAIQSLAVARMLDEHWKKDTWRNLIDGHIVLNDFSENILKEKRIPEDKIYKKLNFVFQEGETDFSPKLSSDFFLYVGRIEESKGILQILDIANQSDSKILLVGEIREQLKKRVEKIKNVEFLGKLPNEEALNLISNSRALLFPSIWRETMGLVVLEAFSQGVPVIMSDLVVSDLVQHEENGLIFKTNDSQDLLHQMKRLSSDGELRNRLGKNALKKFKEEFSAQKNLKMLLSIYKDVISKKH